MPPVRAMRPMAATYVPGSRPPTRYSLGCALEERGPRSRITAAGRPKPSVRRRGTERRAEETTPRHRTARLGAQDGRGPADEGEAARLGRARGPPTPTWPRSRPRRGRRASSRGSPLPIAAAEERPGRRARGRGTGRAPRGPRGARARGSRRELSAGPPARPRDTSSAWSSRQLRVEGQGEDLPARPSRRPAGRRALPPSGRERRLQVERDRIVDERPDPPLLERRGQGVASRVAHHEEVVDRACVGLLLGQDEAGTVQRREVERRRCSAACRVQRSRCGELDAQDRGLQLVEPAVEPDDLVAVAVALAAVAQPAERAPRASGSFTSTAPPSPSAPEVLGRVEARARRPAPPSVPTAPALVARRRGPGRRPRPAGCRVRRGELEERAQVGRMAVEVHRKERLRPRRERRARPRAGSSVQRRRVDVGEHRRAPRRAIASAREGGRDRGASTTSSPGADAERRRARAASPRCRSPPRRRPAPPSAGASSRSKASTSGPRMNQPESSTRAIAASISGAAPRRGRAKSHERRPAAARAEPVTGSAPGASR